MTKTIFIAEPGEKEIVVMHTIHAQRDLVFKTCTDPNLIPLWWGPKSLMTTVEKMDVKPGGVWRFVQKNTLGNVYVFHGVYHEVVSPEKLIYTFEFEGMPGHVSLETLTFEEQDDNTNLTRKSVFQSIEDRDWKIKFGMDEYADESMDRLAGLLAGRNLLSPP